MAAFRYIWKPAKYSRKSPATRLEPEKGSEISLPHMTIFLDARKTAGPYDHFHQKLWDWGPISGILAYILVCFCTNNLLNFSTTIVGP